MIIPIVKKNLTILILLPLLMSRHNEGHVEMFLKGL